MNIITLEQILITIIATISNIEAKRNWTTLDHNDHITYCDAYADLLDVYADYSDNHPSFNNKVNY